MSSTIPPFEHTFSVQPHDIDELGHVNNIVYLRWVQEIATLHWQRAAPEKEREELLWVVSRHEIDYRSPAKLGDEVRVKTWVGHAKGLTFERHTEIYLVGSQEPLAKAHTFWVPINRQTKKPQRLRPELRVLFSTPSI